MKIIITRHSMCISMKSHDINIDITTCYELFYNVKGLLRPNNTNVLESGEINYFRGGFTG